MDVSGVPERFQIRVDDAVWRDLGERLRRTRFPPPTPGEPWQAGTDIGYLKELVGYWADGFDWPTQERRLNEWPQYTVMLDGVQVHFVHVRSGRADALPLVLAHGWPSLFTEYLPLAAKLQDGFDLVIPSLPGHGYSEVPAGPVTRKWIAEQWHRLMTDVLDYQRYGVVGGDVGGDVVHWMAGLYPDHVVGLHTIHPKASTEGGPLSEAEQAYLHQRDVLEEERDGGYSHLQATRPDTVAAALADSPAGLASWIVDKFDAWADGRITEAFDRDELLTLLTLYWATNTIGTSFRSYYDYPHNPPRPPIIVPVAVTLSAEDHWIAAPSSIAYPRELADRTYPDIRLWHEPAQGGHFLALEQPTLFAADIQTFFNTLT
ncbi:epoxide hydrolase family protein [Kribbella sp. NPDC058245]|uniref:epoxide hydrolase family protein n=1 Tax=Kribbella sp. NPDC058245 TaxID=3346399 RepID=UPI0036EAD6CF